MRRGLYRHPLLSCLLLLACAPDEDVLITAATPRHTASPTPSSAVAGNMLPGTSSTPPSPTPTPTPTPTPSVPSLPSPTGLRSLRITLSQESATLYLAPPSGVLDAGLPHTLQLRAEVLYSDASTDGRVLWQSAAPSRASVDAAGLVVVGTATGSVTLTATSFDGLVATCEVRVEDRAALDLTIE